MQYILEDGQSISPLFSIPWVTKECCRIDWLHCADQGVSADYLGNLFYMLLPKLPGANMNARVGSLWTRVQRFYEEQGVGDRLQNLTLKMIKQSKKSPKLRGGAAHVRALVPLGLQLAQEYLSGGTPVEEAAFQGMRRLSECYKALSHDSVFASDVLRRNATEFGLQYCALEAFSGGTKVWRVKPKLHMFLELCSEGSKPATFWTYRDEDFGGSMSRMARRRGGLLSVRAFSANLLQRFRIHQPMLRITQ